MTKELVGKKRMTDIDKHVYSVIGDGRQGQGSITAPTGNGTALLPAGGASSTIAANLPTRQLALLHQLRDVISMALDANSLLRSVVDAIHQVFGYSLISISRLEGDELVLVHWVGFQLHRSDVPQRFSIEHGVAGRAVRSRQPQFVEDIRTSADFVNYGGSLDIVSEIALPLFAQEKVAGLLNVESHGSQALTRNDFDLLITVGEYVSLGLERVYLIERLRDRQERNLALLQSLPDLFFVCDLTGMVLDYHAGNPDVLLVSPSEFLNKPLTTFMPPALARQSQQATAAFVHSRQAQSFEYSLEMPHGRRYFEAQHSACGADKMLVRVRDITPQIEAQEQLRASQQQLGQYLNVVPIALLVFSQTELTLANQTARQMFENELPLGIPIEQIVQSFPVFVAGTDMPYAKDHWPLVRSLAGEACWADDMELRFPERTLHLEIHSTPIWNQQGQVESAIVAVEDITQRKKAENELRESERRLLQFLEAIPIGVIVRQSDGKLYFANESARHMFNGALIDDVRNISITDTYQVYQTGTEQTFPNEQLPTMRALHGETAFADNIELRFPSERVAIEAHASPIWNERSEVEFAVTTVLDITERRQAEEVLAKRSAQVEEAARMKDEFLANMSHELRTPLNSVLTLTEALRDEIYGPVTPEQVEVYQQVERSGRHLLGLINDILDVSKIEAGKMRLDLSIVDVQTLCQNCLNMVRETARYKRIAISQTIDSQVETMEGDARRLSQILINLLSNAVKFTPEDGKVGLEVVSDSEHRTIDFCIWDTGIGISASDQKKLFRPFVQLNSSLARQHEGTGLGLTLVKRLVEMHGGTITLKSKVGEGSRFTVSLPWSVDSTLSEHNKRTGKKSSLATKAAIRPSQLSFLVAPLVLVADDNEISLSTIDSYLTPRSYRTILVRNGNEAIEQALKHQPDIILMDIQMPGVDGLAVARHLRVQPELAQTPMIALTALAMPGDRERCLEAGYNEYLSKPYSLRTLAQLIERQLSTSKGLNK